MEKLFQSSRFAVVVAVIVTAVSAALLYLVSINLLFNTVVGVFMNVPETTDQGKNLVVTLLKLLDITLIAITLHLVAVSLFRLFITPIKATESTFLNILNIKDFQDLKITIIHVSVVVMTILFLEHAVEQGASLESLYFGAGIALVIWASVYASGKMH
ncbi:YqhA family protein [Marinimicrobium sp. ABcell2]|uniref:YqhA family protein n=1 Tax=Marinimicrobium sp. ABcell2 TaxID=3069751 RepID=UPI0027B7041B|nr:YqhA family protein [Marinimicrobium sp. ABcell2]MDQ2077139.1 YqhA family protein [Marinimicrobium sp. ABcell2]